MALSERHAVRYRAGALALAAACMAGVVAGCSSSAASGTVGTGRGTGPSGSPIEFGMISATGPNTPAADTFILPGINAAVAAVNARGGVNGHPLKLDFCNTYGSLNQTEQCAQQFASNQAIVATIGNNNYSGQAQIDAILGKAGVPAIATNMTIADEYTDPLVYPVDAGTMAGFEGGFALMAARGVKTLAVSTFQNQSSQPAVDTVKSLVLPQFPGRSLVGAQYLPPTTTDLTSSAAALIADHPDGIFLGLGTETISYAQSLLSQGYKGFIGMPSVSVTSAQLKTLDVPPGNLAINSTVAHAGTGWDQYQAELGKYQASAVSTASDYSVSAWIGVHLLAALAAKIPGTVTRAALVKALNSLSGYSTGGLTPPISFTKPDPQPGYPRVFNPVVYGLTFEHSALVDIKPLAYVDIFTGKSTTFG
jgi:branched-chain amino acid transport system substrate-binding protein